MKNFILGFISMFLIITFIFMPLGFIIFNKWLDLESKGE